MTVVEKGSSVQGATWDRQTGGAPCECGQPKAKVVRTLAWDENRAEHYRVRYHDCQDCGLRFKSIEVDVKPAAAEVDLARGLRADAFHPLRR